ncbi:MAG: hypothetical protein AAF770_01450 [Bacteroidota bacterium]
MNQNAAQEVTQKVIQLFSLEGYTMRLVSTSIQGQQRRLDVAMSMIHSSKVLFLVTYN